MKKIGFILFVCLLFTSCTMGDSGLDDVTGLVVMCKQPSIAPNKWGKTCCIDQDNNGMCDRDEQTNATELTQRTIHIGDQQESNY